MEEIWKDIDGYEGRYQVSNLGNVKSLNYRGHGFQKNLTPKINNTGYQGVQLSNNNNTKYRLIHRLVAQAFIPNPDNKPVVNHKDENPLHNTVDNLEWSDQLYNVRYTLERHPNGDFVEHIRNSHRKYKGPNAGRNRKDLKERKVAQFTINDELVKIWDNALQVKREENKSQWSITQCCDGKRKTAYGYKWYFIDAV